MAVLELLTTYVSFTSLNLGCDFFFPLGSLCTQKGTGRLVGEWFMHLTNTPLHVAEFHLALMGQRNTSICSHYIFRLEVTTRVHRIGPKGFTQKVILASFSHLKPSPIPISSFLMPFFSRGLGKIVTWASISNRPTEVWHYFPLPILPIILRQVHMTFDPVGDREPSALILQLLPQFHLIKRWRTIYA